MQLLLITRPSRRLQDQQLETTLRNEMKDKKKLKLAAVIDRVGWNYLSSRHPDRDFIELVVPILQERGISRTEYEPDTLRGNLELPRPAFRKI